MRTFSKLIFTAFSFGKDSFLKRLLSGFFALCLIALGNSVFAFESSLGIDLGEKIHWEDGNPYNAHSFTLHFDLSGDNFGIKPFFAFSFSESLLSNMADGVVKYNYAEKGFAETVGVKPYFMFRKTENAASYIGILFSLNFYQESRETSKVTVDGLEWNENYTTGELGFFVGNRWIVSERITVFAECDFSSGLFSKTTTFELDGTAVDNYKSAMFGGGGTTSWRLNITPRVGVSWKL